MKLRWMICCAIAALVSMSFGEATNTVQFGGEEPDRYWNDGYVINSNVSPTEYSISFGVPEHYQDTEISNLLFTVTFLETNDVMHIRNEWLAGTNGHASRLDGDEAIIYKVSYSDPDNKLLSLKMNGFGTRFSDNTGETMIYTVGEDSFLMTETANTFIQDFDATGMTQLTKETVGTWSMMVIEDNSLTDTEGAPGAFVLEYVADTMYIEPPLEPIEFDFNNNNPLDSTGVGATMLVDGLTLTTVEIVGQDGSLASQGAGHQMNSTANNALGVNSAVNVGGFDQNARDFNPGEKWIFSFDADVNFIDIDFAGWTDEGSEMTVSWATYTNVFYGTYNGDTLVFPDNTLVPANTEISLYMSTNNPTTDVQVRVPYLTVLPLQAPDYSFEGWAADQGLTNGINAFSDDPDNDEMDNLLEYALGANSLSNDISAFMPGYALLSDGSTNYLNYVYRRRLDRVERGLVYTVGSSEDLVYDPATNITVEVGSALIDQTFEFVTNQVSADTASKQFMQLKVTID